MTDPVAPRPCTPRHAARSACGRVRTRNEDSHVLAPELGLFAVADGMGGHRAGDRASRLAVKTLRRHLGDSDPRSGDLGVDALREAFRRANATIYGEGQDGTARQGMGTTLTALIVRDDRYWIGHVGDSRAWRYRAGVCEQLTRDHTMVAEQVRQGIIAAEQADHHPMRNVLTRSLGHTEEVDVDVLEGTIQPGDVFMLASDGLFRVFDEQRLTELLATRPEPEALAERLVATACEEDGSDNVTVVVVACDPADPEAAGP